ncbi:uncharacterized protein [Venturia canescens]|uniref:uncharacterized protein n=1 Tax=Venturia canescens TaxID=32260 RepID=UPI001C9CE769|nr:uncharacterized protein LOC122416785 [Venturia canescens]
MKFSLAFLVALAVVRFGNVNAGPVGSSNELQDVVDEFLALVPTEKVNDLLAEYAQNDEAFQSFLDHLFSKEFEKLYDDVERLQAVRDLYKYLAETGLDVYGLINKIHDIFGLPPFPIYHTTRLRSNRGINGFLNDVKALLPLDHIKKLYEQKMQTSVAYYDFVQRFSTKYFQDTFNALRQIPKYCQIIDFLEDSGLSVNDFKDLMLSLLNLHMPSISCRYSYSRMGKSLELTRSLAEKTDLNKDLQDFVALVPSSKIRKIAVKHFIFDSEFRTAYNYVKSEEFYKLVREVHGIPEYKKLLKALEDLGLDVDALVKSIHDAIGFKTVSSPQIAAYPRSVASFIAEVKAVLPVSRIESLYKEKLANSESFEALVDLIKSQLFQDITNALFADPIFQDFLHKAQKHGVNLNAIADFFFNVFGITTPPGIIDCLNNSLEWGCAYIKRIKTLRDHQGQNITAEMKLCLALLAALAVSGVSNVNAVPIKSSELHDVLNEFLALVPKEKVTAIFFEYLDKDAEVQAVLKYMSSDAFRELVQKVESIEDVINFYDYLEKSGLDVYGLVNKLHEVIGLPPIVTGKIGTSLKITGGVAGLWKDIKAVLPIDAIKALYHEKLETSPAFAELVKRLSSPRFQELINALRANKEFRKIVSFLKEAGVDINAIKDVLATMFGLQFPDQYSMARDAQNTDLVQDLVDFLGLLPMEKINDVATEYFYNDAEVQQAAEFVRSEEFKQLLTEAEQNDQFYAFVNFLDKAGFPATFLINELNRALHVEDLKPSLFQMLRRSGKGVRGMLDEIEALVPYDQVKAMFEYKLEHSQVFSNFIQQLRSPQFKSIVLDLAHNKNFEKLGYRAADFGINLEAIASFVSRVFGINL